MNELNKNSNSLSYTNNNSHILHLYASNVNKYAIPVQFLSTITENEKIIYVTNVPLDQHLLKELESLTRHITVLKPANLHKQRFPIYRKLRIVIDGGSIDTDPLSLERLLSRLKLIRNHRILCTYPMTKMNSHVLKQLVAGHDDLILTTEDKVVLSSNKFLDKFDLSEETLEKFVKNYLNTVILVLLLKQPMCGTDIIKTIHKEFNVLLSPAAVYPLLHTLMKDGLLKYDYVIKKKVYKVAENSGYKIKDMINEHLQANKLLTQLLGYSELKTNE